MNKLETALRMLVKDNETRGAQGAEVNWAAIHYAQAALAELKARLKCRSSHE